MDTINNLSDLSMPDLRALAEAATKEISAREAVVSFSARNQITRKVDAVISGQKANWFDVLGIQRPMFRNRTDHSVLWSGRLQGREPKWASVSPEVLAQQVVMGNRDLETIRFFCRRLDAAAYKTSSKLVADLTDLGFDKETVTQYVGARYAA